MAESGVGIISSGAGWSGLDESIIRDSVNAFLPTVDIGVVVIIINVERVMESNECDD